MRALSSYVAKQCHFALHLDHLPGSLRPTPAPTDELLELHAEMGRAFETEVGARLLALHPDLTVIRTRGSGGEGATLDAMGRGERLIWNASLPDDLVARRSGMPDLLVRHGDVPDGGVWRYVPADVKNHHAYDELSAKSKALIVTSPLAVVEVNVGESAPGACGADDLLQLAHYWRMLETIGRTPEGIDPVAGVIGKDDLTPILVWVPLRLDKYDGAFAEAIAVITAAEATPAAAGETAITSAAVRSYRHADCEGCQWIGICKPMWIERGPLARD